MCTNTEVSLVQQEIPVSKMPSSGNGSYTTGWPEVPLGNSGHKSKTKSRKTIDLDDKKMWVFMLGFLLNNIKHLCDHWQIPSSPRLLLFSSVN